MLEVVEEGWWKGKIGQKEGVFPSNFVEEITEESTSSERTSSISHPEKSAPPLPPQSESVDHTPAPSMLFIEISIYVHFIMACYNVRT